LVVAAPFERQRQQFAMNKLHSMLAFVRVAESGSFTAAAAQLGVSVSAVAKAVTRLEDELKTQLLVRSTRKVALNDDGRAYYRRCQQILNDIEDAESSVQKSKQSARGRLRMAMPVLFWRITFLPNFAAFTARYPDIVVDLSLEDRPVDLIERGFDVAVQVGELHDSAYVSRMLNRGPRLTAASAAYLKQHGVPEKPADLAAHNCIGTPSGEVWEFQENGRHVEVPIKGSLVVTGGDARREAALMGLGVVQTNWWTLSGDIAAGRLTPLLERHAVDGQPLSVVYPPTRHIPQKVRLMVDFLVEITRLPASVERTLLTRRRPRAPRK
jgi:DNA-binding transcriptional LysR family regulator